MEAMNLIVGLSMIGCGFLVKKYPNLIAGYNTMSKAEKKNVDIEKLSTFMRNGFIIIGLIIIVGHYSFKLLGLESITNFVMPVAIFLGVVIMVIGVQKYNHNKKGISTYVFLGIVAALVIGLLVYGCIPTKIIINNSTIQFTGAYGYKLKIEDVNAVELVDKIPAITLKTNGFDFWMAKKGNFKLEEFGKCKLFLVSNKAPFLIVTTKSGSKTIINNKNPIITEEYYKNVSPLII